MVFYTTFRIPFRSEFSFRRVLSETGTHRGTASGGSSRMSVIVACARGSQQNRRCIGPCLCRCCPGPVIQSLFCSRRRDFTPPFFFSQFRRRRTQLSWV